jgi:hypothetical protein
MIYESVNDYPWRVITYATIDLRQKNFKVNEINDVTRNSNVYISAAMIQRREVKSLIFAEILFTLTMQAFAQRYFHVSMVQSPARSYNAAGTIS